MSRLSKFVGKPETLVIEDEEFSIHPLKGKHLQLFMNQEANDEQKMDMAVKIIYHSLKPSEEVTEEEIKELPTPVFNAILEKAMEVNGLAQKDTALERIKQRQQATK